MAAGGRERVNFERILLATDGSATARPAIEHAMELAKLANGRVTALYVMDFSGLGSLPPPADWQSLQEVVQADGERALREARETGERQGVQVETRLADGHPADEIAKLSADHDLVVMGTLGRSGLAHFLLGSVAEQVIRHASCPVLVVRAKR